MTTALSNSSYNNNHSAGFTLIELMVTIAVLAIIVSIAAPNVSTQLANQRVKATTATLVSALKEAKAESVIRRQALEFSFDASNHSIAIKTKEDSPVEVASYSYSSKSIIKADETSITFSPSKRADAVTLNVCDNYSATTMQVIVTTAANINSVAGGTCS